MKSSRFLLVPLLLLFAAQLAVPLAQVWQEEGIRRDGLPFTLALHPVDPYDIMRGRYLRLAFPEEGARVPPPAGSVEGDTVYAVLETGADGLAHIARLSATPADNAFAVPLVIDTITAEDGSTETLAQVFIPLTRFYLPEDDAIAIDDLWRWRRNEENAPNIQASLGVRVKNGRIVAESLWLNGQPYHDWLRENAAKSDTKTP
ncbi:MAG: GDYXXLXY domain-containing protein [Cardiobacteriaceae bacterium]|nr:GDYXXLXY domain-containing protein [Cardiobacteriaceae bacterium]